MNLHQIASGAIGTVNPFITVSIEVSTGYATQADGVRVPTYAAPVDASAQVQPLTAGEIRQLDALNIQGNKIAIYVNGHIDGLVRPENKGGDLITITDPPNAGTWLVVQVLEQWPDWCKFACMLQDD